MPLIQVQNLSKSVPDSGRMLTILDDVSFDVQAGETVAIIGASGSGKSTLLGLLAGLDLPTSGDVQVDGQSLFAWDEEQRAHWRAEQVGFVFQFYNLVPTLTARENVGVCEYLSDDPMPLDDLLADLGLADHRNKFPSQLSGGQQRRVALARALLVRPRLLLLDEPFTGLDALLRRELTELLRREQRSRGLTTVFVTHDEEDAARIADSTARFYDTAGTRSFRQASSQRF